MKQRILIIYTLLIFQFGYTQSHFSQISLSKQNGLDPDVAFFLNQLYEVKDISRFEIPDGLPDFVIAYLDISYYHSLYSARFVNNDCWLKYQSRITDNNIDTLQFAYNNVKKTKLYALIYIQNGIKKLIIDTDFDNSFINEKVHEFDISKKVANNHDDNEFISENIKLLVDSLHHPISKMLPIKILMNYLEPSDKIGNNDSLQVYISPDFYYRGYIVDGRDTVIIKLNTQFFDQFYIKEDISGVFFCQSCHMTEPTSFVLRKPFQIKNHIYMFNDFDPIDKTLTVEKLADSDTGTQAGNYFAKSAGLDSLRDYTLVFFTGSWCRPCKIVLDSLLRFHNLHPEITIINVNHEVDSSEFTTYVNKYKIPWKVICDNKTSKQWSSFYRDKYGIEGFPTLFLVNPQKRILKRSSSLNNCLQLLSQIQVNGCKSFEMQFDF